MDCFAALAMTGAVRAKCYCSRRLGAHGRLRSAAAQSIAAGLPFQPKRRALSAKEPKVDEALAVAHGLKPDEYPRFVALIGRTPTFTELGIVSAMWNEHCSYKSSRLHLRRLPTKGPRVIQGPGENAGRHRHRRRRRLRLQDGEPQPSLVHRALPGRGDRGRRHPARRLHHGRAAGRLPQLPALRLARSPQDPPSRRRRGRRASAATAIRSACRRSAARSASTSATTATSSSTRWRSASRGATRSSTPRRPASGIRSSISARRPAATASTARPWPRPPSRRTPKRSARPCRSAIRSPRSCCSRPASS